jgi:hypothetical protein
MTETDTLSNLVPSAKALMEKIALAEGEKATAAMRLHAQQEAEKKALIDRLSKPSGDRGRAINQLEPGWEATLTGIPKEIYEFWDRRLRPLGYKLRVQIVDFSGGVPGDVGMTLKWG